MITLEAGVLRWDGTRLHDQENRLVMIVERILRRINPAKKESQDGARTKEEEEKDGSPPRSGGKNFAELLLETGCRRTRATAGLGDGAGCQPAGAQSPTFVERRAIADLDRHA